MPRALCLVAGVTLLAGGFFVAALRRVSPETASALQADDASRRDQLRGLATENQRLHGENARLAKELERLRAGPPAPAHQRIHETLLPVLASGKEEACEPALLVMAGIDPLDQPCAEALLDLLARAHGERVRLLAAQALSMKRDRFPDLERGAVAGGLAEAAEHDRSSDVRLAALESLDGGTPPEKHLDGLLDLAAADAKVAVRVAAARALASAHPAARGPFLARLERIFEAESTREVRLALVAAAAQAGGEAARPTLERMRRAAPALAGEIDGVIAGIAAEPK